MLCWIFRLRLLVYFSRMSLIVFPWITEDVRETDFPHEALRKNVMQRLFDVVDTYVGNIAAWRGYGISDNRRKS